MAEKRNQSGTARFTLLPEKQPNNPPPGSESWRVTDLAPDSKITILEDGTPRSASVPESGATVPS